MKTVLFHYSKAAIFSVNSARLSDIKKVKQFIIHQNHSFSSFIKMSLNSSIDLNNSLQSTEISAQTVTSAITITSKKPRIVFNTGKKE